MNSDPKSFFCRLCAELQPEYDLIDINDEKSISINLSNKISHCYNIKMTNDDLLPKQVCSDCCNKVVSAFEFYEQVQKAQEILIKRIIHVKQENTNNLLSTEEIKTDDCIVDDNLSNDIKYDDSCHSSSDDYKPLSKRNKSTSVLNELKNESFKNFPSLHSENNLRNDANNKKPVKLEKKEKWKCYDCHELIATGKKLHSHYLTVHKKPPVFGCPDCPKVYNNYASYKSHKRVHKNNNICQICGRNCRDPACLRQHMQTHSDLTPFSCTECNKAFKTLRLLQSHQKSHVPTEIRKKFECDVCEKKFVAKAQLNMHKEYHITSEPQKNFVCEQCGKNFRHKSTLIHHISSHLDIFPFRCDQCPKAFKNLNSLQRHKRNHLDRQPFKCEICLRLFRHKRGLNRHSNIHSSKLPYECEHCKKCFREKSYLKLHLRQHTGERPYSCMECNHHFANDSNFIKHLKGRHGLDKFSVANQRQYPFVN